MMFEWYLCQSLNIFSLDRYFKLGRMVLFFTKDIDILFPAAFDLKNLCYDRFIEP